MAQDSLAWLFQSPPPPRKRPVGTRAANPHVQASGSSYFFAGAGPPQRGRLADLLNNTTPTTFMRIVQSPGPDYGFGMNPGSASSSFSSTNGPALHNFIIRAGRPRRQANLSAISPSRGTAEQSRRRRGARSLPVPVSGLQGIPPRFQHLPGTRSPSRTRILHSSAPLPFGLRTSSPNTVRMRSHSCRKGLHVSDFDDRLAGPEQAGARRRRSHRAPASTGIDWHTCTGHPDHLQRSTMPIHRFDEVHWPS